MEKRRKVIQLPDLQGPRYNAEVERANNIVGLRIAQARKERDLSLVTFSKRLESFGVRVGAAGINKWETGASTPSSYQLLAICHALDIPKGLSYFTGDYRPLLSVEGRRRLEEYRTDLIASGRYKPEPPDPNSIEYVDEKVSLLGVAAGSGEFLDDENFETISFPAASIPPGAEFGIRVSGDSMEPVYQDGQIVWVKQVEHLAVGEVGIFICDGDGFIKVYGEQQPPKEQEDDFKDEYGNIRPQVVLISYNQAYAPRPISPNSEFKVVGKVL